MVKRNKNFSKLQSGYLFPEINKRKQKVMQENPDAKIISLGIGNTTEPLTPYITKALVNAAKGMGSTKGYSGYGEEQGMDELRKKIAENLYNNIVKPEEVFISDGAKCDIGRLQVMFGPDVIVGVQNPSYPVYVDGSVLIGATKDYNKETGLFNGISYFECSPKNDFFPDLSKISRADIIYFCSPNNPTGAVATKDQLKELVKFAKKNKSIIIFDAAYSEYIQDPQLPKSIFEIEGAREVALEVSSFSKSLGFTGLRLGWTVVPQELKFEDGSYVIKDWNRVMTTIFNGASNVVQLAAISALDDKGMKEMNQTVDYYMENAKLIKNGLKSIGIKSYGGIDSPYIWAEFPGKKSWDVFSNILEKCFIVTTPGAGFGQAGEGFIRFSAFGHRKDVEEAVERLKKMIY
ncbi:MAG: LL-diaminopimelate aminotransferase [Candidatus Woesearchaeota archaeon]